MSIQIISQAQLYEIFKRIRDAITIEQLNYIQQEYGNGPFGKEITDYINYKSKEVRETEKRHKRLLTAPKQRTKAFLDQREKDREIEWVRHYQLGKLSPIFQDSPMTNVAMPPEDENFFQPFFENMNLYRIENFADAQVFPSSIPPPLQPIRKNFDRHTNWPVDPYNPTSNRSQYNIHPFINPSSEYHAKKRWKSLNPEMFSSDDSEEYNEEEDDEEYDDEEEDYRQYQSPRSMESSDDPDEPKKTTIFIDSDEEYDRLSRIIDETNDIDDLRDLIAQMTPIFQVEKDKAISKMRRLQKGITPVAHSDETYRKRYYKRMNKLIDETDDFEELSKIYVGINARYKDLQKKCMDKIQKYRKAVEHDIDEINDINDLKHIYQDYIPTYCRDLKKKCMDKIKRLEDEAAIKRRRHTHTQEKETIYVSEHSSEEELPPETHVRQIWPPPQSREHTHTSAHTKNPPQNDEDYDRFEYLIDNTNDIEQLKGLITQMGQAFPDLTGIAESKIDDIIHLQLMSQKQYDWGMIPLFEGIRTSDDPDELRWYAQNHDNEDIRQYAHAKLIGLKLPRIPSPPSAPQLIPHTQFFTSTQKQPPDSPQPRYTTYPQITYTPTQSPPQNPQQSPDTQNHEEGVDFYKAYDELIDETNDIETLKRIVVEIPKEYTQLKDKTKNKIKQLREQQKIDKDMFEKFNALIDKTNDIDELRYYAKELPDTLRHKALTKIENIEKSKSQPQPDQQIRDLYNRIHSTNDFDELYNIERHTTNENIRRAVFDRIEYLRPYTTLIYDDDFIRNTPQGDPNQWPPMRNPTRSKIYKWLLSCNDNKPLSVQKIALIIAALAQHLHLVVYDFHYQDLGRQMNWFVMYIRDILGLINGSKGKIVEIELINENFVLSKLNWDRIPDD